MDLPSKYPVLYLIKGKRGRYSLFNEPTSKDSIQAHLENLLGGNVRFKKMGNPEEPFFFRNIKIDL